MRGKPSFLLVMILATTEDNQLLDSYKPIAKIFDLVKTKQILPEGIVDISAYYHYTFQMTNMRFMMLVMF